MSQCVYPCIKHLLSSLVAPPTKVLLSVTIPPTTISTTIFSTYMYILIKEGTVNTYTGCRTYNRGGVGFHLQKCLEKTGGLPVYGAIHEGYNTGSFLNRSFPHLRHRTTCLIGVTTRC